MEIELGMKVKIKTTCEVNAGYTGRVESILHGKSDHNIGVDIDGDHENPTPFYYNAEMVRLLQNPVYIYLSICLYADELLSTARILQNHCCEPLFILYSCLCQIGAI